LFNILLNKDIKSRRPTSVAVHRAPKGPVVIRDTGLLMKPILLILQAGNPEATGHKATVQFNQKRSLITFEPDLRSWRSHTGIIDEPARGVPYVGFALLVEAESKAIYLSSRMLLKTV
jgi:hypothetical protein